VDFHRELPANFGDIEPRIIGQIGETCNLPYNAGMSTAGESCPLPPRRIHASTKASAPRWIYWTLVVAGIYNLVWGAIVVLFPSQPFESLGMPQPNYPQLWQCIGMVVGVYGVGYWIAAYDPARHWPIVFVGWLGKVLGPIGFLSAALAGELPWAFGLVNVTNDLIWWLPFTAILYNAWRTNSAPSDAPPLSLEEALQSVQSQRGRTIGELSSKQSPGSIQSPDQWSGCSAKAASTAESPRPMVGALQPGGVLLLFIRHAGCTFCREALAELAAARKQLEAKGLKLAVAHMSAVDTASALLARYGLDGIDHFSDPDCRLFRAFNLARGSFWQVLGPAVWVRGLPALVRHGIGKMDGDGFQLGGAFLVRDGKVVAAQRLATSAERADLAALVNAA
jgi:hypothetical protein